MDSLRRVLIDISKQINSETLANLKYMCQDVVTAARMERVATALDLFQALEECGKISTSNTQYLVDLLEAEGKPGLVTRLARFGSSSTNQAFPQSLLSYSEIEQQRFQRNRNNFPNVPENRLNVYRLLLRRISNSLTIEEIKELCYISQEAEVAGIQHRTNLSGAVLFNFLEECQLITPDNLEYLRESLHQIRRQDLQNLIEQYIESFLHVQPLPLNAMHQLYHQPPAVNPQFQQDQSSLEGHYSFTPERTPSMNSMQAQPDEDHISLPTQVENHDDDAYNPYAQGIAGNANALLENELHTIMNQKEALMSQRERLGDIAYQNSLQQLEEREMQYRRELELKEKQLEDQKMELRDRENVIDQISQQNEQHLHLLTQVKAESNSEKERLRQQIREYEQMLQQNVDQMQILRQENQRGRMPIGPTGEKYQMSKSPHGIAIIINNYEFHSANPSEDPLPDRRGSQVDEENLRVTWEYLRYEVRILRNLSASEITRQLMQIALQSHENYDSFICCILSHGYLDGVYGTDSKPVKINDLASLFKGTFCPTLADKPKLFFIQACRGDDEDRGVAVQKDAKGDADDAFRHSLPSEADFLFGYATPPGNVSWRSPRYGSWYISKLCEVFVDYSPQQDLLSMLTIVNQKVSEAYTTQGYKQCPAPVTLLRKQVWFFGNSDVVVNVLA